MVKHFEFLFVQEDFLIKFAVESSSSHIPQKPFFIPPISTEIYKYVLGLKIMKIFQN